MHVQAPMSLAETIRSWGAPRALHATIREMGIPCFELPYRAPLPDGSYWRPCKSHELYRNNYDDAGVAFVECWNWGTCGWERLG